MNDLPSIARQARSNLARALSALQEDQVPPKTQALASVVAEAMNLLHRLEKNYDTAGFDCWDHSTRTLLLVRNALNSLQSPEHSHPSTESVLEPAAQAVRLVHQLNQLTAARESEPPKPESLAPTDRAPTGHGGTTQAHLTEQTNGAAARSNGATASSAASEQNTASTGANQTPPTTSLGESAAANTSVVNTSVVNTSVVDTSIVNTQANPSAVNGSPGGTVAAENSSTPAPVEPAGPVTIADQNADSPRTAPSPELESVEGDESQVSSAPDESQPLPNTDNASTTQAHAVEPQDQDSTLAGSKFNSINPAAERQSANPDRPSINPVALPALDPLPGEVYIEVALGAYSTSNFYKHLREGDVVDSGGLFVASYTPPELSQSVRVRATLSGGFAFEGRGTVDWRREMPKSGSLNPLTPPGFGLRFTELSDDARKMVYRYSRSREPFLRDVDGAQ